MFKKLSLILVLMVALICPKPAQAYENYVDGITTIEEVLDYTLNYHVDRPKLDDLVNGAIEGMLDSLNDPHTEYMTPESLKNFTDSLDANYVGIGIKMEAEGDYPKVVAVFDNSPAQKANLRVGDIIIKVNGQSAYQEPLSAVADKVRGVEGTTVTLTLQRGKEQFDVTLKRSAVNAPTVTTDIIFDNIGYVAIDSFGTETSNEFTAAIQQIKSSAVDGLIIDLRNNTGGYLMSAVHITEHFLPVGTAVVSVVDNNRESIVYRSYGTGRAAGIPLVILVNGNTASAAEILAGALQDHGVATLVGAQTYGKGTVQTLFNLHNGGALKVTAAKYQLPGGRYIDGVGIEPDKKILSPGLEIHGAKQLIKPDDQIQVEFTVGENRAVVNGKQYRLMGAPYQKNGVYYIPLRFAMESLGYQVEWDDARNGSYLTGLGKKLFIPANGETIHPLEVANFISYISVPDLKNLGFNCQVDAQRIKVIKD
ncbi:S41 family peptidase [Desulfofalx alkaliphila]|uniref:S41 family peptidase n=1 Tax=Desulfofalx alkaliphila TaxID=105483 RepID=UPI0004E0D017|nr:S41 family peptidase [Desulfofalx alkaliphila]